MSKRRNQRHVQGPRGEAFLRLTRGVPREQIVCVSIDVHKYSHKVMLLNGYQEILEPCFEIDTFRTGFQQLCNVIDQVVAKTKAKVLFIGMEPTGHYFENLARHLRSRYPHVRLVNTFAVSQNRGQKMNPKLKTDEIDLGSIGDLVLRNECFPYQPLSGDHLHLQNGVRFRRAKVKVRTALRNQIIGHLDRIFPGLVRPNKDAQGEYPALFAKFWENQTAQRLIRLCPDPRKLAHMQPAELVEMFRARHWRMGEVTASRIIQFAQQVLLPSEEMIDARLPYLQYDLSVLDVLDEVIAKTEKQMEHHLAKTEGRLLPHIKGMGIVHAASYVAGIGNPSHYEHAGQTFKRSGLISGRNDSGLHQRAGAGHHVTKVGDPYLRSALIQLTRSLCQWQPYFGKYYAHLIARGKHQGVAIVATARKANGVLFALMRDQSEFDPRDEQGRPILPRTSVRDPGKETPDRGSCKAKA